MKPALVVTPTIGSPELRDCIQSVIKQDYENLEYLLVIDGPQYEEQVLSILRDVAPTDIVVRHVTLPYNSGGDGWYGHRIIAAFSHLVNHDYVMFLDQDNMLEAHHVSSLVAKLESGDYDWVYSLRKIYSKDGKFICEDDCESLGKWPIEGDPVNGYLIDTSCYFYKSEFIRKTGSLWDSGWGGDRRYYNLLTTKFNHTNFDCSGESTLLYRLGSSSDEPLKRDAFNESNKIVRDLYKGSELPWRKK